MPRPFLLLAGPAAVFPPGVEIRRDPACGAEPAQTLDVICRTRPGEAPVLVMVHGGAWVTGDKAERTVGDFLRSLGLPWPSPRRPVAAALDE